MKNAFHHETDEIHEKDRMKGITRFGLLRHATTRWNEEKRIQGQSDSPLSDEGRRQAGAWGRSLKGFSWDRILASDTGRAFATAGLVNEALRLPILFDSRLREQDWGAWTGKTIGDVTDAAARILEDLGGNRWAFAPPGGETRIEVLERSRTALLEAAVRWPGENILVVTHEGVIKCLVYRLLEKDFLPPETNLLQPRCLHWVACRDGVLEVERINALDLSS